MTSLSNDLLKIEDPNLIILDTDPKNGCLEGNNRKIKRLQRTGFFKVFYHAPKHKINRINNRI